MGEVKKSSFFDNLDEIRVSQDYLAAVPAKKKFTAKVGKPKPDKFFRVHPAMELRMGALELKSEGELYLLAPDIQAGVMHEFPALCRIVSMVLIVDRFGNYTVWPIRVAAVENARRNEWWESALAAADDGRKHWIRMEANMGAGNYDVHVAQGNLPDPVWPEESWSEILEIAFRGMIIDDAEHLALQELRGEK